VEAPQGMVRLTRACVLLRVPYYKLWRRVTAGELLAEMIEGRWYVREGALQHALTERDRLHRDRRRLPRPRRANGTFLPTNRPSETAPAQAAG
jgi:hypothetical protein